VLPEPQAVLNKKSAKTMKRAAKRQFNGSLIKVMIAVKTSFTIIKLRIVRKKYPLSTLNS
jgi:hypothetical protein